MKKLALLALSGILLASMTGCGSNAQAAEAEYIYGQIDSVSGNDIVLLLADYNENAASSQEEADKQSEESGSERKKPEKGEMPDDFDPSQFSGEKPEGFSMPENGEMPEGFDSSQFGGERPKRSSDSEDGETSEKPDTSKFSRRRSGSSKYTLTGEQEELRIPVEGELYIENVPSSGRREAHFLYGETGGKRMNSRASARLFFTVSLSSYHAPP